MQLSLSHSTAPVSTETGDLLSAPAGPFADQPDTGFGELMADLLPPPATPAAPDSPGADLAGVQAAVDFLAWLARAVPPPPPPSMLPAADVGPGDDLATSTTEALEGQMALSAGSDGAVATGSSAPVAGAPLPLQTWSRWHAREGSVPSSPFAADELTPAAAQPPELAAPEPMPPALAIPSATGEANLVDMTSSTPAGKEVLAADPERVISQLPPWAIAPRNRGEARGDARGEKIAAGARSLQMLANPSEIGTEKNFLNIDKELDAESLNPVGIGFAKPEINMSFSTLTSPASAARPDSGATVPAVDAMAGMREDSPQPATAQTTPAGLAHTAVAAVAKAVERAEAAPRTAVNLQFSIGDSDLVVRIEHRAEEVRATFRTDSSELRAALSSEWQSAVSAGSDHALRRVEPVFTSASSNEDPRPFADGNAAGSQQRQPGREASGEPSIPFAAILRRPATAAPEARSESNPVVRAALLPNALHLQTFA